MINSKKFLVLVLLLLVCASSVCTPPALARHHRGLKPFSQEWILYWDMYWATHDHWWTNFTPGWTPSLPGATPTPTTAVSATVAPASFTPPTPANATVLTFKNASGSDVYLCVSTQSGALPCSNGSIMQDGCPYKVSQLGVLDLATNIPGAFVKWPSTAPTNGWYLWKNGHTVQVYNNMTNPYTGKNNGCLQGLVFGVNIWGANCACNYQAPGTVPAGDFRCNGFPDTNPKSPTYNSDTPATYTLVPNGSTAFEPSLNLPGMQCNQSYGNNPHESYDITCVNGSNAILSVTMTPPSGGPYFTYNVGNGSQTASSTFTTKNSWVLVNPSTAKASCDDNCIDPSAAIAGSSRAGVYPYGATVCTTNPDPNAPCTTTADPYAQNKQFCAAKSTSGCNFDRAPATGQVFGGTIAVTYTGPATPPATCP